MLCGSTVGNLADIEPYQHTMDDVSTAETDLDKLISE